MRERLSGPSRKLLILSALAALSCGAAGVRVEARRQQPQPPQQSRASAEEPLTNAGVVKLVRAKFAEKTIIAVIRSRPARFDLSPDRLVELKRAGVPERVILAMLARDESNMLARQGAADDDDFSNDPFFEGFGGATAGGAQAPQSDPNETNIFGSSGGARGRTRTNGLGGGAEGETQTTGSASVRIIRPPAEAGGVAAPKLERTPTLTNESVVEMVNAGFSEGTIIRRIEQSPADFNLSPAKLDELRRRRVTDPVIEAMRAAMGDDAQQTPNAQPRP